MKWLTTDGLECPIIDGKPRTFKRYFRMDNHYSKLEYEI